MTSKCCKSYHILTSFVIPLLESFWFWDKDDNENEIFSILSSARARTNVILEGKCGSRRYSTTSFKENVVVAKTSYQMLGILSFSDRERALPPSKEISELTFVLKKVQWSFPVCLFLESRRENLKLNVVLVVVLVLEFEAREHGLIYLPNTMNSGKEKRLNWLVAYAAVWFVPATAFLVQFSSHRHCFSYWLLPFFFIVFVNSFFKTSPEPFTCSK